MIGEHVHTVSFLKNIMDQADVMTENTAMSRVDQVVGWVGPVVPGADQVVVVLVKTDAWATSTCSWWAVR